MQGFADLCQCVSEQVSVWYVYLCVCRVASQRTSKDGKIMLSSALGKGGVAERYQ